MTENLSDDVNDFCHIDSETRALPGAHGPEGDVTKCGVDVYQHNAYAVLWTFTIGDDAAGLQALDAGFDKRLKWRDMPKKIHDFYDRAKAGKAWFTAWNMGFDRAIWNGPESDYPPLEIEMTIDIMAQGAASGLPGKLEHAGKAAGFGGKLAEGGNLIKMFAPADGATPQSHPEHWEQFKAYGLRDTELLRDVAQATRPLTREEWTDYWVCEHINQRGMPVDTGFAERAAAVAALNRLQCNENIRRFSNGEIEKVTQATAIRDYVYDRLDSAEARDIMVKSWALDEEDDLKPSKLSLDKDKGQALLNWFDAQGELSEYDQTTRDVAEQRLLGSSNSPAKFGKIVLMQRDNVLRNQYVFNGAGQTGRFSSRGVQIHNLIRDSLREREDDFIEMINDLEV